MQKSQRCPLCSSCGTAYFEHRKRLFYRCGCCRGIFLSKDLLPDSISEFLRYKKHQNDINDPGYQEFAAPLVSAVTNDFTTAHIGLDFGSGTESAVSKLLTDKGFQITKFDPFFHNDKKLLEAKYDYIVCCEVIEHFHNPHREFELLKRLLRPEGRLYCMTHIYTEDIDFSLWYYKNDITHVFFYSPETIEWIRKEFDFKDARINGRLAVLNQTLR